VDYCETIPLAGRKEKKRFRMRAAAGDGWGRWFGFNLAPDARYDLTVSETDDGTYVTGAATDYPNIELWQYSDNAPPKLIYSSQTPRGPFGGPISLLPPNPMVPIPPH